MGRWLTLALLFALASCDAVFGLYGDPTGDSNKGDAPPAPDAVPGSPPDGACAVAMCNGSGDTHDEDRDCTPDACDPCPHLPLVTGDLDNDLVGDACDENPNVRSIPAFTSFVTGDGFILATASLWTFEDDLLHGMTEPQVAYAYHEQLSRVPYRIATRVTLPIVSTLGYAGVAFLMTRPRGAPTTGFVAILNRRLSGALELAIYAPPTSGVLGRPVGGVDPTVMDSAGRTFELTVNVTMSSMSVTARDIFTNETRSFVASGMNVPMNSSDGVVVGPYEDVDFAYWFRSQNVP